MSKCSGCGIKLQNTDSQKLGYTPLLTNKYCERCFRMTHYNEEKKVPNIDNTKIINKINNLNLLTIFITDFLSLNSDVIATYKKIKNNKVLVINKCDLIPSNLKLEHIKSNLQKAFAIKEDILFVSAKKNINLTSLINIIKEQGKVIICGETSSGKSTIINKLFNSNLTTSKYNNTTLDFIKINYLDCLIYDTPGLIINPEKLNLESISEITKKVSKEYVLELNNIRIKGEGNFTFYLSNNINLKSKKDDEVLTKEIIVNKPSDIELGGEGFIFIKNPCILNSNVSLKIRDSIIGR